jgi:hypothetical protein
MSRRTLFTKDQAKAAAAVMAAFGEGKLIEYRAWDSTGDWRLTSIPSWNWFGNNYRVKPEKQYLIAYRTTGTDKWYGTTPTPECLERYADCKKPWFSDGFEYRLIEIPE